ncbi:MAG: hypothetical protein ACE5D7_05035 [Fidelibacterota bacterium]
MKDLESTEFLNAIHQKIKRKKKRKAAVNAGFTVLLSVAISIQSTKMIYETKLEQLWNLRSSYTMVWEWENINEIDEVESLEYLIDEMDIDELVDFIDKEYDAVKWLKSIKLEG